MEKIEQALEVDDEPPWRHNTFPNRAAHMVALLAPYNRLCARSETIALWDSFSRGNFRSSDFVLAAKRPKSRRGSLLCVWRKFRSIFGD